MNFNSLELFDCSNLFGWNFCLHTVSKNYFARKSLNGFFSQLTSICICVCMFLYVMYCCTAVFVAWDLWYWLLTEMRL